MVTNPLLNDKKRLKREEIPTQVGKTGSSFREMAFCRLKNGVWSPDSTAGAHQKSGGNVQGGEFRAAEEGP